jgi:hypothetical protein
MTLKADETELRGSWLMRPGGLVADATCQRIEDLLPALEKLGTSGAGWSALDRDPGDGRLWELTFWQSELHGGGPPRLAVVSLNEAHEHYPSLVPS